MASYPRAALFFLVLLVAPLFLCSSATTLDEEERQKEEQALEEEEYEAEDESRADGVPDPPQNLVVDPQSDTLVFLFWEDPADNTDLDHYFVYVEEVGMEQTTSDKFCAFDNLEASTEYTFGVMSVSAEGNMSEPVLGKGQTLEADDGVPDPPQNLLVQPQTPTSIMLIWQDPDDTTDLDHYLVYVEGEDMQGTTKINYYLVESLEPCTDYTFGVMSVSVEGNTSDPILENGETGIGAPPAPQNLTVDGYSSTTVTLSWDEPDTLCDVNEYRVKWFKDEFDPQNERTNETSFTVTGLSIDTTYTFTVTGFTEYGEGEEEATVQQTTKLFDGGPPENLVAVGVSESEVNVSWTPPAYEPLYYVLTAMPCTFMVENVFGLSYLITGLDPCANCNVFVTSFYNDTFQYTAETVGTTQGGDPPPPKTCTVEVVEGAITVEWSKPDTNCVVRIYSGHWTRTKLWGDGEEVSGSGNVSGTIFNVFDPVPYSQYTFEISASIDGVFGSPASCSGTSLETQPGSPVIVDVDSVQGEAVVTWETPAEENGLIVQYRIFVDEKAEPDKIVNGDVHSTSLTLDPCETYSLSIEAENGAGWGPRSEAKDVIVVDDVLPETVDCSLSDFNVEVCWDPYDETCPVSEYNLIWEGDVLWSEELADSNSTSLEWSTNRTCQSIAGLPYTTYYVELTVGSGTDYKNCSVTTPMAAPGPPADVSVTTEDLTIHVTWHEPEEKNGVIAFYQVEWEILNGGGSSQSTGDTFYDIPGLECGVTVDVTVRAQVEEVDEFGDRSSPQRAYLVNSVENLDCKPAGSGQVSLSWTVTDPECPINSYNVTWGYESLWSENADQGWQDVGKDETSTDVTSLPPYANVSIQVHVDNNPEYTECYAITPEKESSKPTNLQQIANTSSSVTITWGLPQNLNGEHQGWHLRWTKLDDEAIGDDTVNDVQNRTYMITDLSHDNTYVVYVSAVNGVGNGQEEKINATTLHIPADTSPNVGLIVGLSTAGGILLIIILIGGFILVRKKGSSKPPRSAPHMPEVADADSDELYKMQHLSSATQRFQNKLGSVDYGTNSELYTSPRPSLPKDEPADDDVDKSSYAQLNSDNDRGQMFGAPADRRFSQQIATNLPRLGAYNRRPSQQVNSRMRSFEEYNRRPSQQDLTGRPSFSGGPDRPSLGEFGRRPSQQVDLGRPNLAQYGRRPSQQVDLGRPNLAQYGRRPSQQVDLGRPNLAQYGRRPSQQADLGKPRLGEYGRRPSQQIDLGKPMLSEYGRRPSQQIDIGRPASREYSRRPSQQLPSGGGSYPSPLSQQEAPRRSSVDLYSRRSSQQADIGRPGDRMFMKRPSQQFIPSFEGIQEL